MEPQALPRTLTLWPAVGLAVTMVVGSGVLVLPGIAYAEHPSSAFWTWVTAAVICAPLLRMIAVLGSRHPSAGGLAGFVRPSLGARPARMCELLLLASAPGGAGLALVAGHLVSDVFARDWLVEPVASGLLVIATVIALRGVEFAGALVRVVAGAFIVVLGVVAIGGMLAGGDGTGLGTISSGGYGITGVGTVFFAFVGWELMAFLSEEFTEPQRDFPRMIAISFGVVTALYLALAAAVQLVLDPQDARLQTSPVATVAARVFGGTGRAIVTIVGLVIVMTNVNGVVLAFSRLVLNAARGGVLPRQLAATTGRGVPRRAVVATACGFAAFIVPVHLGVLTQGALFKVAGSALFAGFVVTSVAYCVEARQQTERVFGYITFTVAMVVQITFGWVALYPAAVLVVGIATTWRRSTQTPDPDRGA